MANIGYSLRSSASSIAATKGAEKTIANRHQWTRIDSSIRVYLRSFAVRKSSQKNKNRNQCSAA
jgi:hypothetical protein